MTVVEPVTRAQHLVLVEELARNVTGKVSRQELRSMFSPNDLPQA